MRLILVSNRVACPKEDEPMQGGLASALLPAVRTSGAIWVGCDGKSSEGVEKEGFARVEALGSGAVATIDVPSAHYRAFYEGFANSALWPALHSRADLIQTCTEDYAAYRRVNALMARALLRFARPDAVIWVHDYHYFAMAAELRKLGIELPIGFFLHTPFPTRQVFTSLPHHRDLMQAMLSYDLIGFQTDDDVENFAGYLEQELGLVGQDNVIPSSNGDIRLASFPIGIDVNEFAERAVRSVRRPEVMRLRDSLAGSRLLIGVDRVDYSKGLSNRFRAFDRLLALQQTAKRAVTLLQIGVPSREGIETYQELQTGLATLVGDINARHGEVDWTPVRYLNKAYCQSTLAGFYRSAHVGVVTSFNDGMNLVAKEYVAAQDPLDPGVLVLSKFTGASRQLDAALLVNPHDIDGIARGLSLALAMPSGERRERWDAMMRTLKSSSLETWFSEFVVALSECPRSLRPVPAAPPPDVSPMRPRRPGLTAVSRI
jgi:trehalose 6-phosphate synthase